MRFEATFVGIAGLLLVDPCSSSKALAAGHAWSAEERANFISACRQQMGAANSLFKGHCECSFERVKLLGGAAQLETGLAAKDPKLLERLTAVSAECLDRDPTAYARFLDQLERAQCTQDGGPSRGCKCITRGIYKAWPTASRYMAAQADKARWKDENRRIAKVCIDAEKNGSGATPRVAQVGNLWGSPDGRFFLAFPTPPEPISVHANGGAGVGYRAIVQSQSGWTQYLVTATTVDVFKSRPPESQVREIIDGATDVFAQSLGTSRASVRKTWGKFGSRLPKLDHRFQYVREETEIETTGFFTMVGMTMYRVSASYPLASADVQRDSVEAFLRSFVVKDEEGDGDKEALAVGAGRSKVGLSLTGEDPAEEELPRAKRASQRSSEAALNAPFDVAAQQGLPSPALLSFVQGKKKRFSSVGHPKAKGLAFTIDYPDSWTAKEPERPNIVQTFKGAEDPAGPPPMVMVSVTDLPAELLGSGEDFVDEQMTREIVTQMGGKAGSLGMTTIEGEKAGWATFDVSLDRAAVPMRMKCLLFMLVHEGKLFQYQCQVGGASSDSSIDSRFAGYLPLCKQIANTIIFPEKRK